MSLERPDCKRNRRRAAAAYLISVAAVGLYFWFNRPPGGRVDAGLSENLPSTPASTGGRIEGIPTRQPGGDQPGDPARSGAPGASAGPAPATATGVIAVSEPQMRRGRAIYRMACFGCHQLEGQGVPGQIPPLAQADFLLNNTADSIRGLLAGRSDAIVVNGKTYKGIMLPMNYLSDDFIADVMSYALNSWGNSGNPVTPGEVARIRRTAVPPAPQGESGKPSQRMPGAAGR